jgi:hypothetical protein
VDLGSLPRADRLRDPDNVVLGTAGYEG